MQIKFRGLRFDNKQWVDGHYFATVKCHYIIDDATLFAIRQQVWSGWIEVDPATVGMFTGLFDKNGTEIYGAMGGPGEVGEKGGDIVRKNNKNYFVAWNNAGFWYMQRTNDFWPKLFVVDSSKLEVIGTVAENGELLELKNKNQN